MEKINKRQKEFLVEILDNRIPVDAAMETLDVGTKLLCQWFSSPVFLNELARRIECMSKRADMLISQHRLTAVERLVRLTNCEKEETARKACLDIIELTADDGKDSKDAQIPHLSPETAAKLLEILANDNET